MVGRVHPQEHEVARDDPAGSRYAQRENLLDGLQARRPQHPLPATDLSLGILSRNSLEERAIFESRDPFQEQAMPNGFGDIPVRIIGNPLGTPVGALRAEASYNALEFPEQSGHVSSVVELRLCATRVERHKQVVMGVEQIIQESEVWQGIVPRKDQDLDGVHHLETHDVCPHGVCWLEHHGRHHQQTWHQHEQLAGEASQVLVVTADHPPRQVPSPPPATRIMYCSHQSLY